VKILVVAEMQLGRLKPSNGAAIRFAQDLAEKTGGSFDIVLIGHKLTDHVVDLNRYAAGAFHVIDAPRFENYLPGSFCEAVVALVKARNYTAVIGGEATTARDIFPRIAGALSAGMCKGVSAVEEINGALCYRRAVFSGMALRTERIQTPIHVLTVDPTAIDEPNEGPPAEVAPFDAPGEDDDRVRFVERRRAESGRPDLAVAERVIGAGRGIKSGEYLETIGTLADKLGAAIGSTRAVVDAGWLPNEFQVGQTGKAIAPKLYIAIGISGAVQHAAGIRGAKTIVAINKDPEAPIFKIADVGLVGDLFDAVPKLIERL
jgi:electron transfer flavoprotein alpha subunit